MICATRTSNLCSWAIYVTAVVVSVEEYQAYVSATRKEQPGFSEYLLSIPRSDIELERMKPDLRELET